MSRKEEAKLRKHIEGLDNEIKSLKTQHELALYQAELKREKQLGKWKAKYETIESVVKQVQGIASEEHMVNTCIIGKLEKLVFKYRSDIKELKKIIMTPRLHQKYVTAVKQRNTLVERGLPIPDELDIDIYELTSTGNTPAISRQAARTFRATSKSSAFEEVKKITDS